MQAPLVAFRRSFTFAHFHDDSFALRTLDALRAVVDSPKVAVAKITGKLASGTYTAKWNAVAADGAKGSGDFSFMYMSMMKPE